MPPTDDACARDAATLLTVDSAREHIFAATRVRAGGERLNPRQALGRINADDIFSPVNVPAWNNSAMDGYAFTAAGLPSSGDCRLTCVGTAWAGHPLNAPVMPGQCARIMTGAPIPEGCDTVIMQEQVTVDGDQISFQKRPTPGDNVREIGEDLAAGEMVLPAGKRVGAAELGLLASLGINEITVKPKIRVVFFSTGDELRAVGEPLDDGGIYDSNRHAFYGLLNHPWIEALDFGIIPDNREALRGAFERAAELGEVVITTGGVSVGEADFVKDMLNELGRVDFWKIAIKPGKPLAFGHLGAALFFGLPGNPVSAMVTFQQFVFPALLRLAGGLVEAPPRFWVECAQTLRKRPGRMEFQRGVLFRENGKLKVRDTGIQSSGVLSSMSRANCFILLPADSGGAQPGDQVEVELC